MDENPIIMDDLPWGPPISGNLHLGLSRLREFPAPAAQTSARRHHPPWIPDAVGGGEINHDIP